jgi:hypothetical protein
MAAAKFLEALFGQVAENGKRFKELSYEELIELENNGTIYRAVRHRPR